MHRFFILYTFIILSALGGLAYYGFYHLEDDFVVNLPREDGLIEISTAICFVLAAFLGFVQFLKHSTKMNFVFFTLMALAGAREMDWHKEWTSQSILKSRFYTDANTGDLEKIIGVAVIVFLLYAVFQLVKRVPLFIANLWAFQSTSWGVAMGLGTLTIAKGMDSLARLAPSLEDFKNENYAYMNLMEESLELAGALFFISVVIMMMKRG